MIVNVYSSPGVRSISFFHSPKHSCFSKFQSLHFRSSYPLAMAVTFASVKLSLVGSIAYISATPVLPVSGVSSRPSSTVSPEISRSWNSIFFTAPCSGSICTLYLLSGVPRDEIPFFWVFACFSIIFAFTVLFFASFIAIVALLFFSGSGLFAVVDMVLGIFWVVSRALLLVWFSWIGWPDGVELFCEMSGRVM